MFGNTFSFDLTRDAAGVPTGVANVKEETLISGVLAGVTSQLDDDKVVVGMGRTLATVGVAYGSAQFARKQLTGQFTLNPWSSEA